MSLRSLFSRKQDQSPEAEFWNWFIDNQDMLFHFQRHQDKAFRRLHKALSKVHPDLAFEFGIPDDTHREFVISADGLKAAFPAVERLYAAAPEIPNWTITKFRQPRPVMSIGIGNVVLAPDDIEVAVSVRDDKAELSVFVRGYDGSMDGPIMQLVFVVLDHAIGEYVMETRVGTIDVKPFDDSTTLTRHSLSELPDVIDRVLT